MITLSIHVFKQFSPVHLLMLFPRVFLDDDFLEFFFDFIKPMFID